MKVWQAAGSATQFQALLSRLQAKVAVGEPFLIENIIVPVALVDPPSLTATLAPMTFDTPVATAGELTAPAANTRLADTLALAVGGWNFWFYIFTAGEANTFRLRRRNSADAADIWALRIQHGGAGQTSLLFPFPGRLALAAGERLAIENVTVGGAGIVYQAAIFYQGPF